jgi:hypothetical protein
MSLSDQNTIDLQATGEVPLWVNDWNAGLFDNSGSFRVKVSHQSTNF